MLDLGERLAELRASGLHRRLRVVEGPQGPAVELDGRAVMLLCSNNYLGLADHPACGARRPTPRSSWAPAPAPRG